MKTIKSSIDESVNFVVPHGEGMLESRYVRRQPDYFICYLSSQSGCTKGCKFCHLTTTKQTSFNQATVTDFALQARPVIEHYLTKPQAKVVNFNWMARGEALDNPDILKRWYLVYKCLYDELYIEGASHLDIRYNISTIMPRTLKDSLSHIFRHGPYPTIYYSLYSMNQEWRDKWLPGAMPPDQALGELKKYQDITQKIVYIHGAFIKDENDSYDSVQSMIDCIKARDLIIKWNIVRYNPFSPVEGEESPRLRGIERQLKLAFGASNIQIVSRLDKSTFAPCGMFYSGELYV